MKSSYEDSVLSSGYGDPLLDHLIRRAVPKNPFTIRLVSAWISVPEILNPSCPELDDFEVLSQAKETIDHFRDPNCRCLFATWVIDRGLFQGGANESPLLDLLDF